MEASCQERPKNISFFIRPKKPSHAELFGVQPFFDIERISPASFIRLIQLGQR